MWTKGKINSSKLVCDKILRNIIPQEKVVETQQIINVVIQPVVSEPVQNIGVNTDAAKIAAIIAAVQHHKNLKG